MLANKNVGHSYEFRFGKKTKNLHLSKKIISCFYYHFFVLNLLVMQVLVVLYFLYVLAELLFESYVAKKIHCKFY